IDQLVQQYSPNSLLAPALGAFDVVATRNWLNDLGIPTFVGTSRRVFPQPEIKPAQVLQKWKDRLLDQGVTFHLHHRFIGFSETFLPILEHLGHQSTVEAEAYIFALGAASWPKTGSNGHWVDAFRQLPVPICTFQPSNCGVLVNWDKNLLAPHFGKPLKNIAIQCEDRVVKGEAILSNYGLEGNAIYPLIPSIRTQLANTYQAQLTIDFKPNNQWAQLLGKYKAERGNTKTYARQLNLNKVELALLKAQTTQDEFQDPKQFISKVKALTISVNGLRPIEEAISCAGGVDQVALNTDFSLKDFPQIYTIGEMVDWDAPTGGFLLQACFSMGYFVGQNLLK
ncbi:MAG: TIGR03862 family flavoprotein, partial [Bacteroidota bacterium]